MHNTIVVFNSRGNWVWPVGTFLGGIAVVLYGMAVVTRMRLRIVSFHARLSTSLDLKAVVRLGYVLRR